MTFARLFFFALLSFVFSVNLWFTGSAFARLPETSAEHSLLYWRYLCRDQSQEESVKNQIRELKCPAKGWTVRAPAAEGRVKEIIEHDAP